MDWLFGSSVRKPPARDPEPSIPSPASAPSPTPQFQPPPPQPPSDDDELMHLSFGLPMPQPASGPTGSILSPAPSPIPSMPESSEPKSIVTYPEKMSCRELFDFAYYCQSLGGQFNNVWRYGETRSCKSHWKAWAFCTQLKTHGKEAKRAHVREWYRKQEEEKYGGPEERGPEKAREWALRGGDPGEWKKSSADVWEERRVKVKMAFDRDPVEDGILERRRREKREGR